MKKNIIALIAVVVIAILAGIFIGSQPGCKRMKGGYEVVGFPQSFADLAERADHSTWHFARYQHATSDSGHAARVLEQKRERNRG